jgi:hypothetical protein
LIKPNKTAMAVFLWAVGYAAIALTVLLTLSGRVVMLGYALRANRNLR